MIQNIVFDMGNVLLGFDPEYIASQFAPDADARKALLAAIFYAPEWQMLDAGTLSEEDMYRRIARRLPPPLVAAGIDAFRDWHLHYHRIPEAESLVSDLKAAGYRLYLLSNASVRWREYRHDYPVLSMLDGHVVSALVGAAKPDAAIYRILFDTFGLAPAESYYVDDLPANLEAGRALGMDGFLLDHFQYGALRDALKSTGVRI